MSKHIWNSGESRKEREIGNRIDSDLKMRLTFSRSAAEVSLGGSHIKPEKSRLQAEHLGVTCSIKSCST